jgi:polar amino acid transport system substrate-binding protein
MGVEVEFFPAPFHALIPDLLKSRTDIIISGLSIEAQRALAVNFSAPYNSTAVTLAANAKSSGARKTMAEFNNPEVTVGALEGSTAEEMSGILLPNARIKVYDEDDQLFQDLIAGKLDAAVTDSPRPEIIANLFPAQVVFPALPPLATFPAAFAVRRGDMDFINFLNSWIAARTDNGWLENRRAYWFKGTEWSKDL